MGEEPDGKKQPQPIGAVTFSDQHPERMPAEATRLQRERNVNAT
jgi:hypothetical protein